MVVVGAGGLGCPALQYLAAAGVGKSISPSRSSFCLLTDSGTPTPPTHRARANAHTAGRIGIIDHDVVELSNLQRQTLHTESKLGKPKAESAASALKEFVPCRVISPFLASSRVLMPLFPVSVFAGSTRASA